MAHDECHHRLSGLVSRGVEAISFSEPMIERAARRDKPPPSVFGPSVS
jgi:hypothetical protein